MNLPAFWAFAACSKITHHFKLEDKLAALEGKLHVVASLKDWFDKGLEQIRRNGDRKLLELLTSGLQDSRAVATHAPRAARTPDRGQSGFR